MYKPVTFLTCVLHNTKEILCCLLFVQFLGIRTFVLHFWLLFYLSEGLIFIPPNNLVFAQANAGMSVQGGGRDHGEHKHSLFFVGKFVAIPVLSLAGKVGQQEWNS